MAMADEAAPITITERAAQEVKTIMLTKNIPAAYALRIGVRGGGCSAAPLIGFDVRSEKDRAYSIAGITVISDKAHVLYVAGKTVDFYEGADARGFSFVD